MKTNSPQNKINGVKLSRLDRVQTNSNNSERKSIGVSSVDTLRGSKTEQDLEKEIENNKKNYGVCPECGIELGLISEAKLEGYQLAKKEIKDKILKKLFPTEEERYYGIKLEYEKIKSLLDDIQSSSNEELLEGL